MDNEKVVKPKENGGKGAKAVFIIGIVLCSILGLMLIMNLTIIIKGAVNPDRPPSIFGVTPLAVMTDSMSGDAEDHIEGGDLIFSVKVRDFDELEVGDIISFMEDKGTTPTTHRIIEICYDDNGNRYYRTQGDANNAPDGGRVYESEILGEFKVRLGNMGTFAMFLEKPLGLVIFAGIPVLALIIYEVVRRIIDQKKAQAKTDEMQAEIDRLRILAGEAPAKADSEEAAEEDFSAEE